MPIPKWFAHCPQHLPPPVCLVLLVCLSRLQSDWPHYLSWLAKRHKRLVDRLRRW